MASDSTAPSPDGSSWEKAYPTLGAAIDAAAPGSEIWIKTGTYKPTNGTDRSAAFRLKSSLTIRGGFLGNETAAYPRNPWANPTILSGDIGTPMVGAVTDTNPYPREAASVDDAGWNDNSYNVLVGEGVQNVVLEYVTVTGASATNPGIPAVDIEGYEMYSANPAVPGAQSIGKPSSTVVGGGLYFTTGASWNLTDYGVTLQGCRFTRNHARGYGGAVAAYDASLWIDTCQFEENVSDGAGGAFWGLNQQTAFIHTDFTDNLSRSGGGAVSIKSVPKYWSADSPSFSPDELNNGIQKYTLAAFGIDQAVKETKEDDNGRISKAMSDYGIYKSLASPAVRDGSRGFFSSMANKLSPSSPDAVKLVRKPVGKVNANKDKMVQIEDLGTLSSFNTRQTNLFATVRLGTQAGNYANTTLAGFNLLAQSNPLYQSWTNFNGNFNRYAVPEVADSNFLVDAITAGKDKVTTNVVALKKTALQNYYRVGGRSAFAVCKFSGNETESVGGAIELVYTNLLVESCTFTDNRAVTDGAAISSSVYCMPQVISSLFSNNYSDQGASAISNSNSSLMIVSNSTIINNKSFGNDGVALSALMGADVRVYNSILWNNANPLKTKGADVFAATPDTLSPGTRAKYDALQYGQQVNWVGIMEIRNSVVQSLKTIPLGEDKTSITLRIGDALNSSQLEIDAQIAAAKAVRDAADAIGELEGVGSVNAGWGIRPQLRDASYGNSDADPLLLAKPLGKPSRRSPVYNAGNDRWSSGRLIDHVSLLDIFRDVADQNRIANSKVDIGAYEIDPSKPDEFTQLAGQGTGAASDAPLATGVGAGAPPTISSTLPGTVIYRVKAGATGSGASWNDPADLKSAISHADAEVWVAAGTYQPGSQRTDSLVMADGVQIFGGFAGVVSETKRSDRNWRTNLTIISGDIGVPGVPTDNSINLISNLNLDGPAILDGFTFRDTYGRGAISSHHSSLLIQNCVFRDNQSVDSGGAINCGGSAASTTTLVNCQFYNNSAQQNGGAISSSKSLFGHNLIFSGNTASGGGAISMTGPGTNQYCTIQNGLFTGNSSSSGTGGAILSRGGYLNVQNSTFYGNTSTAGSALKVGGGAIDHAFTTAAGTASAVVLNSIFYKNNTTNTAGGGVETMEKRQILTADPLLLSHSLLQGLNTYAGGEAGANFDADPLFVAEGTDFRLQPQSLGVDGGDSSDVYTEFLTVDLAGNQRPFNYAIDLGPYEQTAVTPPHLVTTVTQTTNPAGEGETGTGSHVFSSNYDASLGDTVRWYVDRGDGLGFVALDEDSTENVGVRSDTLTVLSPPNGFSYRLQVIRNGVVYISPVSRLLPTDNSRYVFVKPFATGDGTGTSWPDATDLQSALANAPAGAEIWVAEGTYRPTTVADRDAHFSLAKSRKLYGGFAVNQMVFSKRDWRAHKTIISGEIGGAGATDNSRNLLINTNVGNSAILDGFHFQDAYGDGVDGGAIRNIASSPTIRNCVFKTNHARNGGAISSEGISSNSGYGPTLFYCEFEGNTAELAGGALHYIGSLHSHNLIFKGNTARTGGAAYSVGIEDGQTAIFENSLFAGNQASAGFGGAVFGENINLDANNCTFYGNQATINSTGPAGGGAIYLDDSSGSNNVTSNNSIYYKNTALNDGTGGRGSVELQQIFMNGGRAGIVRNSLVEGLDLYNANSNNTNIDADPLFVAEGSDFHLSKFSIAIDAGANPANPNFEMTDLDGEDRVINTTIDLGAYEHEAVAANPLRKVTASPQGLENYSYTVQFDVQAQDVLQWYVDRGDGNGFVVLGTKDRPIGLPANVYVDPETNPLPVEYVGVNSASLNILSPPSGYRFQLRLRRGLDVFYSPVKQLKPTEISKGSYVYVRPVATGDGSGSGWINATSDLQAALSRTNAEVWVQEGTYYPTSGTDRDQAFSLTTYGVRVYGGFKGGESLRVARNAASNVTKISGAIGGPQKEDNSRHLFKNQVDVGAYTVLDGLTFEDAYADGEDGGAVQNTNTSPTFQNCVFQNNYARNGGAIFSSGTNYFGSALIDCKFKNNSALLGGGAISSTSAHFVTNALFEGNQAGSGGAINLARGSDRLAFDLKNGLFFNNRALNGNGGAISSNGISLYLANSTFYGNQSQRGSATRLGGGAVIVEGANANATVSNSIFYANSCVNSGAGGLESIELQQIIANGGYVSANHSLIQGLNEYAYNDFDANFDEDPEFVNPAVGNFHLSNVSGAINAGAGSSGSASSSLPQTDLDGNVRVQGGVVDLGPYENTTAAALGRITSNSDFASGVARFHKNANLVVQPGDVLQWYVERGGVWVLLPADSVYSGVNSTTLTITAPPASADGSKFQLQIIRNGVALTTLPSQLSLPLERIYVDSARAGMAATGLNWATAYGDLQQALKASGPGTSIWVAKGTYYPTSGSNTDLAFQIPAGVSVYGGLVPGVGDISNRNLAENATILSGKLAAATSRSAYSRNVVRNQSAQGRAAVLDGFIIQDSYSSLVLNDGASPTIRNCFFEDQNINISDGGAVAIANINGANPLIAECRFLRNSTSSGGLVSISEAGATIENSLFAHNSAPYTGIIVVRNGTVNLVHCTVVDNSSSANTAGLDASNSTATISNSIFWNNKGGYSGLPAYDQAVRILGGSVTIRSSCIQGGESLPAGNKATDPLFAEPTPTVEYALAPYSPLVNAGSTDYPVASGKDLAGKTRVYFGQPDMGVYELQRNIIAPVLLTSLPRSRTVYSTGGSVDFNVSWPAETNFEPYWEVFKIVDGVKVPVDPSRYTIHGGVGADHSATLRLNQISPDDSGIKVLVKAYYYDSVLGENTTLYAPPATLTVRLPRLVLVNPAATGNNDGTSWANAYTDLVTALDNAQTADEIWVAKGTYTATSSSYFQLESTVGVYGGFSGLGTESTRSERNTLLNPTTLHAVGSYPVLYGAAQESEYEIPAVLDGFIIENSTGPISVYNSVASTTYRNCIFRNNAGPQINSQSQIQYDHCEFTGHTGTLLSIDRSTVAISDSTIHGNTTPGDFITSANSSTVTLSDVTASNNTAAGALFRNGGGNGASLTILRGAFRENSTGGAVIANASAGVLEIEGSLFAKNTATADMATLQNSGRLKMTFSTVADNRGGSFGGGVFTYRTAVSTINNSIFWGNRGTRPTSTLEQHQLGDPAGTDGSGALTLTRSFVESVPTPLTAYNPESNLSFYPLFVDPSAGDYHLLPYSPAAITSFSSNMTLLSATDLDKVQRRSSYGAAGAYESPADSANPLLISNYPTSTATTEATDTSFTYVGRDFGQWQYLDGNGNWVNITADTSSYRLIRSSDGSTRTLYFDAPSLALNGTHFRVVLSRTSGGVTETITSGDVVLTVNRPQIIYVNGGSDASGDGRSWATAFKTIQEALAVTNENSEIWVQAGDYAINTANLNWNVHLYGGFAGDETTRANRDLTANEVTLLGGGKQIFLSSDSTTARAAKTTDAVLDGFTLTGATAGTAVRLNQSESIISNCVFRGNNGAISVTGQSAPVITNCVFDSHSSTVLSLEGDSTTISGCSFLDNRNTAGSSGSTVYIYRGNVKITDSSFSGNVTGGATVVAFSDFPATTLSNVINGKATQVTVSRCDMTGNTAYAGIQTNQALLNLDNSLIARNTLYTTAIRGFSESQFNVTNVTIAHNNGSLENVALSNDGRTNLRNSILWGNRTSWPYAALINPGSPALVETSQLKLNSWSLIQNSTIEGAYLVTYGGNPNGNSGYDPLFVDSGTLNYQLDSVSPAINAGSATGIAAGTLDLASQLRLANTPDMGAYEFQGTPGTPVHLSSNLASRSVIVGQNTQYSVQVPAGVTVQWQIKTDPAASFVNVISGGNQVLSGNGGILTLSNLSLGMSGYQFRFILSGGVSYTSGAGTLTVVSKPVIYVNASSAGDNNGASWANAYTSVDSALTAAADPITGGPCEIWVAQGTYAAGRYSIPPGVELHGGFAGGETVRSDRDIPGHPTIFTGAAGLDFRSYLLSDGYPDADKIGIVIDGFTLTGACSGVKISKGPGIVRNCTFVDLQGGGIANYGGPLTLEDSTFTRVTGIGVLGSPASVSSPASNTTIRRSTFQNGSGLGISCYLSNLTVEDSVFQNNTNTSLDNYFGNVFMTRCRIVNNHSNYAVSSKANNNSLNIRQTLIAGNSGSGLYTDMSAALVSVTIAGNEIGIERGSSSALTLVNSIVAENSLYQIYNSPSPSSAHVLSANHSLVQGFGLTSNGNSAWNPQFTNSATGDYTLAPRSPAVDAGTAAYVDDGEIDLAKNARIQSTLPDMGAYESTYAANPLYVTALPASLATTRGVDGGFTISGDSSYTYTWQYFNGSTWVDITYDGGKWVGPDGVILNVTTVAGVSRLTLPGTPLNASGLRFRAVINGQGITTAPVTLTVSESEIIYIDASVAASGDGKTWDTAYKTLFEVTSATSPDPKRITQARRIIYIAGGTYLLPSNGRFEITQRAEIYGGFPAGGGSFAARDSAVHPVILSGEQGDPASLEDNAYPVVYINAYNSPIGSDTIIDGLTIDGGLVGVWVTGNAQPTLRNTIISHNIQNGLRLQTGGGRFDNCQFLENTLNGAASVATGDVTFSGCSFRGNTQVTGGAALALYGGSVRMESCVISGNRSGNDGGGIAVFGGSHVLVNSTVVGNYTDGTSGGGGITNQGALAVWNSIIWANRSAQNPFTSTQTSIKDQQLAGGFDIRSSNIEGLTPSGSNLSVDPLFLSVTEASAAPTTSGDFHIYGGSPVQDAGDDSLLGGLLIDADNSPRSVRTVDMGAYEVQGTASDPLVITQQPADLSIEGQGPNEFHVGLSGTNYNYQWESATNGVFTPVVDGTDFAGAQTATLQVISRDPDLSGMIFRVKITATSGGQVTSGIATLAVYPSQYYVNAAAANDNGKGTTWATAFKTLGTALAKARVNPSGGVQIWVAGGIYTPDPTDTAVSFPLKSKVAVYGGFAGSETALDQRDSVVHPTVLRGIAGSTAVFTRSGTAALTEMRIDGFAISTAATGIAMGQNAGLTVANCSFSGLGTGISGDLGTLSIANSRFTGLTQYGIYTTSTALEIADSIFTTNHQGLVQLAGNLSLLRSSFRGNGATDVNGGALKTSYARASIENCLFSGNYARYGGAIYSDGGTNMNVAFRNCTIAGNYALDGVGGLYFSSGSTNGSVGVYNSVLWGNATAGLGAYAQAYIYGNNPGGNNYAPQDGDPQFVAPLPASIGGTTAGDYRIRPQSVLVNRGSNAAAGTSSTDLAQAPRIFETTVDIGAYELQVIPIRLATQTTDVNAGVGIPGTFSVTGNLPNATYQWQVSTDNGGTWSNVIESAAESGSNTATLSVGAFPEFAGRIYRVYVSAPGAGEIYSNAATYHFNYATVQSPAGVRGQMLTGRTSTAGFAVEGGILPASILDSSFAVHGSQTGRLTLADGSLTGFTISGETVTLQSAVPFKAGESVEVTTTGGIQRADGYAASPTVYQFRAGSQGGYGVFPSANAITGAPATATALASGDVDGNGAVDLVIGGTNGAKVWLNSGAASFASTSQTLGGGTVSQVLLGSLGMTGSTGSRTKLDVILRKSDGNIEIWRNEGDGTFTNTSTITGLGATSLGLADLNGDGALDLFIATAGADQVWFNSGAGVFTDSTQRLGSGGAGLSVAFGGYAEHINSLSVFVANGPEILEIWKNDGSGHFTAGPVTFGGELKRVIAADFDKDGNLDLIGVRNGGDIRIFRQNASAGAAAYRTFPYTDNFQPVGLSPSDPTALGVADLDNDGYSDLVFHYPSAGTTQIWKGQGYSGGQMVFQKIAEQPALPLSKALDLVDLNGDGMMDSVFISTGGVPTVALYAVTPAAPAGLTATVNSDIRISLAWTDNATNETGYSVERSPNGNNAWTVLSSSLPANSTTYVDTAGNPSTRYYYRVRANVGGVLPSAYSNTVNTITPSAISAVGDSIAVTEGATATTLAGGATSLLANDSSPDAGTLEAVVVTPPAHGNLVLNGNGSFSYTPAAAFSGADSFTYRVTNQVTGSSATATVAITVTRLNDAPAGLALANAGGVHYTGQAAGVTVASLSATDSDPEDAGLLSFSLVSGEGSPNNTDFTLSGTTLKTASVIDFSSGLDRSIRIRVTDTMGAFSEQTFTLSFTQAPTASPASFATREDTPVPVTLPGAGGASTLVYEIVSQPGHGSLGGSSGAYLYSPALNFNGSDSFTYRVRDSVLTSATVTVILNIAPVDDAPTLDAVDPITTVENTPVAFTLAGHDVEGDALTYQLTGNPPAAGSVQLNGAVVTYTPNLNALGTETLEFTVSAVGLTSAPIQVVVKIIPVPVPSTVYRGLYEYSDIPAASEGDWSGVLPANISTPDHGTVTLEGSRLLYKHNGDSGTSDSFTYTLTNTAGQLRNIGVMITISDRVIDVVNNANSGNGTLRSAIDITNRFAGDFLAPDLTVTPDWLIRILPAAGRFTTLTSPANEGIDLGFYSHFRIAGKVTVDATANTGYILGSNGSHSARHFVVMPGASLTLKHLQLNGGEASDRTIAAPYPHGGTILNFGSFSAEDVGFGYSRAAVGTAIYNDGGLLSLIRCTFEQCYALWEDDPGGTIASRNGSVTLKDSSFIDNTGRANGNLYVLADGALATVDVSGTAPGSFSIVTANAGTLAVTGLPKAINDSVVYPVRQALNIDIATLLANDLGTTAASVGVSATTAKGVTLTRSGDSILYQAPLNVENGDSFTYTITDAGGLTSTATVALVFNYEPAAPNGNPDQASVYRGLSTEIYVLNNDTGNSGDTLAITAVGTPVRGSAEILEGNRIRYTSHDTATNEDFDSDSFTYSVSNAIGTTRNVVVNITVKDRSLDVDNGGDNPGNPRTIRGALAFINGFGNTTLAPAHNTTPDWTIRIVNAAGQTWTTNSSSYIGGGFSAFEITGKVTIDAVGSPGFALSSGSPYMDDVRNFFVASGASLTLKNLDLVGHGSLFSPYSFTGGSVINEGSLITENVAFHYFVGDTGAAIYNNGGTVSLNHTRFLDNWARNYGNGGDPGIVTSRNGTLFLTDVDFENSNAYPELFVVGDGSTATVHFDGLPGYSYNLTTRNGGGIATPGLPVAKNDSVPRPAGLGLRIPVATLLANDSEATGATLTVGGTSLAGFNVSLSDGVVSYESPDWFEDTDSFTYTLTTASGYSSTATVTLAAYAVSNISVYDPSGNELGGGSTVDVGIVKPGESNTQTFIITNYGSANLENIVITTAGGNADDFHVDGPSNSGLTPYNSTDFTVTFTPSGSGVRSTTLSIASNDPDESPFKITLTGLRNSPPEFSDYVVTVPYQTPSVISLAKILARASDPDGDPLTANALGTSSSRGGTLNWQGGGVTYTPRAGFSGADTFRATIRDNHNASVIVTISVIVDTAASANEMGANPPKLSVMPEGKMALSFQGIPGRSYLVQRSTDMQNWSTIATLTAGGTGKIEFVDENPPSGSGFYRIKRP